MAAVKVQQRVLRRQTSDDAFRLFLAAHEWDLTDPIVIDSRSDLRSEGRWRDSLEPFNHQVDNLITFCRRLPVTLLADDVGLGKTISAGLIVSELIARSRIQKILVVCPKLLGPQWEEELKSKFNIPAQVVAGKEFLAAAPDGVGAVITTYHTARMYLEKLPEDRFQMLILDEAHKLRNLYGTVSPPQVAVRFRKALEQRRFPFVLMLTATPLQNRLWDLYSLVDLLTVARGHTNPFGNEGMFTRRFIEDGKETARRLKPESTNEFRSIVYGYMSRVRRSDAKLYFPDREVQMHRVPPSPGELQLIEMIGERIEEVHPLAQISILQALCSSPEAVASQLRNMGRNGTAPADWADDVWRLVKKMPLTAKLQGLGWLVESLKKQNPDRWRAVIFTTRRETQTTIQAFLEKLGVSVGIINGDTTRTNQEMIGRFRKNPPDVRVIVSTEAGSEGVNLQAANVLVNFDLPWNPMIVEQRIGRVQRLASEHAKVAIFNVTLAGTFEEFIVGRLMEKLTLAAHAIGDIESLLEASGVGGNDAGEGRFEEQIRQLVVASLTGKDVAKDIALKVASIEAAKRTLAEEEEHINSVLGASSGPEYSGPRSPRLPPLQRLMTVPEFVRASARCSGGDLLEIEPGRFEIREGHRCEPVYFDEQNEPIQEASLVTPGSPVFRRLVSRHAGGGWHRVNDAGGTSLQTEELARRWAAEFAKDVIDCSIEASRTCFEGTAHVRARVTVAHDSYERLVAIDCSADQHQSYTRATPDISTEINSVESLGLKLDHLGDAVKRDEGVAEFCRFYLARRDVEVNAAGADERKRKKLEDEFTPRLNAELLAVTGHRISRHSVKVRYRFDDRAAYASELQVEPHSGRILESPARSLCAETKRMVPASCLGRCDVSGAAALKHLLVSSDESARMGLPGHVVSCSVTGRQVLSDEVVVSDVSGERFLKRLAKSSPVTGRRGEPSAFGRCEFTDVDVIADELAQSDISGRQYRMDEACRSIVSGISGHRSEFIRCHVTGTALLSAEADVCDVSAHRVRPGVLQQCSVTKKRALPEYLVGSREGQKVLKSLLVKSSVSGLSILKERAIRSTSGKFCARKESVECSWAAMPTHPEDVVDCELTTLRIRRDFVADSSRLALKPLLEQLQGRKLGADQTDTWNVVAAMLSPLLRGKIRIVSGVLSPDQQSLACCAEVRTLLGFKTRHAGCVYSLKDGRILGSVVIGRRSNGDWLADVEN